MTFSKATRYIEANALKVSNIILYHIMFYLSMQLGLSPSQIIVSAIVIIISIFQYHAVEYTLKASQQCIWKMVLRNTRHWHQKEGKRHTFKFLHHKCVFRQWNQPSILLHIKRSAACGISMLYPKGLCP